jgi:hypothetical protein
MFEGVADTKANVMVGNDGGTLLENASTGKVYHDGQIPAFNVHRTAVVGMKEQVAFGLFAFLGSQDIEGTGSGEEFTLQGFARGTPFL